MTNPNVDLSLRALFGLLWRNRKTFIYIGLITVVISSMVSLFLTEYYKSSVIIFPARTSSLSLNESSVRRGNVSDFGEEQEAEQLLQIINSEVLQERVIERNDLYSHYKIDADGLHARSKIRQLYTSNVSARRTQYNSIDISVIDVDPVKAAAIANSVAEFTDSVKNQMIRQRAQMSLRTIDVEYNRLQDELNKVIMQLDTFQKQGVVTEVERAALVEAFGRIGGRDITSANQLQKQINANLEFGDEYDAQKRRREILTDQFLRFQNIKAQYQADARIEIPQKFVVDPAVPADKKSYPVRWLIVFGALMSVLFFTLLLLIFKEHYSTFFQQK